MARSTLPTPVQFAIEQMLRAGASDVAVAQELGVDRNTVGRYRRRLGLPCFKVREDSPACRYGHPYPENAFRARDGWLRCRTCTRVRSAARWRAAHPPVQREPGSPSRRVWSPVEPDWAAIERAVAGDPPERLTPRERAAAIARLSRWNYTAPEIAERVGCHIRTVYRITGNQAA